MTDVIDQLRGICMALPEASKDHEGVGSPAFKVRGKIFAMCHPMNQRPPMWCKAPRGMQAAIVESDPDHFFVPPYVGVHGWVGHWLDTDIGWTHLRDLIDDSYRMTAPKKLIAQMKS